MKKDLLSASDLSSEEIEQLIEQALVMKREEAPPFRPLLVLLHVARVWLEASSQTKGVPPFEEVLLTNRERLIGSLTPFGHRLRIYARVLWPVD